MRTKYSVEIADSAIKTSLIRLLNQTYKLLPLREEKTDWKKPLETIIEEFAGMQMVLVEHRATLFALICKLEGLYFLDQEEDFLIYRRTIFDCIGLINTVIQQCKV